MALNPKILAVAGKGGVGKTTLSASMIRVLSENCPTAKILAIDADPAVGLSTALGVEVSETLDDIRKRIVGETEDGDTRQAIELLNEARFHILNSMVENRKFAFLAIGRPEAAGCYCAINDYLREVISKVAGDFDYVVIDGEAGIEQINRRVMEKVSHLVLVSDQSRKGINIIGTINRVSRELVMAGEVGAIINRVTNPDLNSSIQVEGVKTLTFIGTDTTLAKNDIEGKSVFELPADAPVLEGVRTALRAMAVI